MSDKLLPLLPSHWLPRSTSQEPLVSPLQEAQSDPYTEAVEYQRSILQRNNSYRSAISAETNASTVRDDTASRQSERGHGSTKESYKIEQRQICQALEQDGSQHAWLEDLWLFEVLAEFIAITSLALMFGVLWHFNDRAQAEWQYSYVTLNGIVAFLATASRTSLMAAVSAAVGQRKWLWFTPNRRTTQKARHLKDFETFDDASRGWLGSMRLMWTVRCWDIACIGALITILAVFFEAITQNVLTTVVDTRDVTGEGLTAGYIPRSDWFNNSAQDGNTGLTLLDVPTLGSVYGGLLSTKVPDLNIQCSTGNCTWPIVPTLAICGACQDLKPQVTKTCDENECTWQIPGGLNITKPLVAPGPSQTWTTPIFKAQLAAGDLLNNGNVTGFPAPGQEGYAGLSFQLMGQSFETFMAPNWLGGAPAAATPFNISSIAAKECGIWICMQARQVNASFGVVTDTIVEHWNKNDGYINFVDIPDSFNVQPGAGYNYSTGMMFNLEMSLGTLLTGEININGNQDILYNMSSFYKDGHPGSANLSFGVDIMHAAWQYADNLDTWWANLAKSLTNNIRLNGITRTPEDGFYDGAALKAVVYYQVRWIWLAPPAALVLLSALFLGITMFASRRSFVRPWKSRALPVLFTRLDESVHEQERRALLGRESPRAGGGKSKVVLDGSGDAWVFREVVKDATA